MKEQPPKAKASLSMNHRRSNREAGEERRLEEVTSRAINNMIYGICRRRTNTKDRADTVPQGDARARQNKDLNELSI